MLDELPILCAPTVYADRPARPRPGVVEADLDRLITALAHHGYHTPSVAGLDRGRLAGGDVPAKRFLPMLLDARASVVARWAETLAVASYSSVLAVGCQDLDDPQAVGAADWPLLRGHGIIIASRGMSGRPLVSLSPAELRDELVASRERIEACFHAQCRLLVPVPDRLGAAVDGLVIEEARRAGYRWVLTPGADVTAPRADAPELHYRTLRSDVQVERLVEWVGGRRLVRATERVRELVGRPQRILRGLLGEA